MIKQLTIQKVLVLLCYTTSNSFSFIFVKDKISAVIVKTQRGFPLQLPSIDINSSLQL